MQNLQEYQNISICRFVKELNLVIVIRKILKLLFLAKTKKPMTFLNHWLFKVFKLFVSIVNPLVVSNFT
jgi:hypothetical protein